MAAICRSHGVTLPEAAVQFPLQHPQVVSVVLGMRDPGQVREGVARIEASVPDALWAELAAAGFIRSAADD